MILSICFCWQFINTKWMVIIQAKEKKYIWNFYLLINEHARLWVQLPSSLEVSRSLPF